MKLSRHTGHNVYHPVFPRELVISAPDVDESQITILIKASGLPDEKDSGEAAIRDDSRMIARAAGPFHTGKCSHRSMRRAVMTMLFEMLHSTIDLPALDFIPFHTCKTQTSHPVPLSHPPVLAPLYIPPIPFYLHSSKMSSLPG